ncbi:hypothetical protein EG329_013500 [Mollisiaceae sp. DMI_Dod_QoI]|nr:hypothetical protein EG329_013500 [Helotiales sp. DMI_Dod_QoI]
MAATKASLSHLERTAAEPRDNSLHTVRVMGITQLNDTVRIFQLAPTVRPVKFLPGQWLDVYCPGVPKAGGFTITSPPSVPIIELAIQKSPSNPPAAWLWQSESTVLNSELQVRVGGSFVWPPPRGVDGLRRVVFLAGGVGINPLMSMVSFITKEVELRRLETGNEGAGLQVKFLYSTKDLQPQESILFMRRLAETFKTLGEKGELRVFLTGGDGAEDESGEFFKIDGETIKARKRRITDDDLIEALGPAEERGNTVCYICGVPSMTDEFVGKARKAEGMLEENILFEKWW